MPQCCILELQSHGSYGSSLHSTPQHKKAGQSRIIVNTIGWVFWYWWNESKLSELSKVNKIKRAYRVTHKKPASKDSHHVMGPNPSPGLHLMLLRLRLYNIKASQLDLGHIRYKLLRPKKISQASVDYKRSAIRMSSYTFPSVVHH